MLTLTCPTGTFDTTALAQGNSERVLTYGIIPDSSDVKTYCTNSELGGSYDDNPCNKWLDKGKIKSALIDFDGTS